MLKVTDEYTAFCLDSAAAHLIYCLEQGKEPDYLKHMTEAEKDRKHEASIRAAQEAIRKRKSKEK